MSQDTQKVIAYTAADCGCQRNTPITGLIRAPLLLALGSPSRFVPLVLADVLAREEGKVVWMHTLVHGRNPAQHKRTKQLHLESRSGSGTAGDSSVHGGLSSGLHKSGSDQC